MNCLIVVPSLHRAGAETQAVDLANGLAANGHSIHFCSFEPQLAQRSRISEQVFFHHLLRESKFDLSLIDRIALLIDEHRIEIVLGVLKIAVLTAWLAAKRSKIKPPVVAGVHTTINRGLKNEILDRLLFRKVFARLPAIIFVCENQRDHWVRKYPELKIKSFVVHNGLEPERFRRADFVDSGRQLLRALNIPQDAIVFACIAAFRPEKGHRILVDAFSHVKGNAYLVFAGDGDFRGSTEILATEIGVRERTRFLGNIEDTRPLIAASTSTVLASTAVETFSMAMLESMALGVPMIAPIIGGLPEAIVDGDTGLLFSIGDVSALASCMQTIVDEPAASMRLGLSAQRKVTQSFTQDTMVEGTERVMKIALRKSLGKEIS